MKLFTGLIGFLIAVLALFFAIANRQTATISLWPFEVEVQAPLYFLTLGTLFVGLVGGAGVAWVWMIPHRLRARRMQKDIANLNQKIMDLQQTVLAPKQLDENFHTPSKSLRRFWRF